MITEGQLNSLKKAFGEGESDYIVMDGWCPRWQWECVRAGIHEGYLEYDPKMSDASSDEQYTAECYRPTEKLKELLKNKESS